jgi:hypothetical protein
MKNRFIIKATGNGKEKYITTVNMVEGVFTDNIEEANKYHSAKNATDTLISLLDKSSDPIFGNYYYQILEVYTNLSV